MSENNCIQTPLQNNIPCLFIVDVLESTSTASFQSQSQSHGFDFAAIQDECNSLKQKNSGRNCENNDSKTDIVDEDKLDTRNSINSLMVKSFTPTSQQVDSINTQLGYLSIDLTQSQEIKTESNKKEKNHFLQLPFKQSKSINYEDEELNNQIDSPDVNSQKNETDSLKSSLIKRVTFSDFMTESTLSNSDQNTNEKQQFFFQSPKGQMVKSDSKCQFSQEKRKIITKSILKRSQTTEQNIEQKKFEDELQMNKFLMDFCCIRNDEFVQSLIKDETNQSLQNEQYFFSEEVIKISNSGEKKKRTILITDEFFYVLQDVYSFKHIQKFEISEINKITISSTQNNVCSFIIRNSFQLNLQIKHLFDLIQFIQTIFKKVLKCHIPIIKDQSQIFKDQTKKSFSQNGQTKMEQFLSSQRKEFRVQIDKITNNTQKEEKQIEGFISFFSSDICVNGLKSQDLNRLTQIELIHTNLEKKYFIFQSKKNSDILYSINLKNEEDILNFVNQINRFYKQKHQKIL